MEALGGLVLSVLLVVVYECVGVYEEAAAAAALFVEARSTCAISRSGGGVAGFDGESWVGGGRSLLRYSRPVGLKTSLVL